MRVKIISDSTCDLSPALLERYDIAVTPLCVIKDGKDFHDGVDITPADIFAHVDGGGDLCSTSAVSQYEYGEMFARYANEYDAVVQITIGANFSCCYQNACAAAQEYANVFVVDSENLSTGQGLLVVAAAKLAEHRAHILTAVVELAEKLECPARVARQDQRHELCGLHVSGQTQRVEHGVRVDRAARGRALVKKAQRVSQRAVRQSGQQRRAVLL